MLSDEKLQADLLTKLKTLSSVTALLGDGASGIKELQWQGVTFLYPCVRFDIENTGYEFDEQEKCQLYFMEFSLFVFSQERSSKQCSQIKGLLENSLTALGWTGTNAKYSRLRMTDSVPSVREDERTWRSQISYRTRLTLP